MAKNPCIISFKNTKGEAPVEYSYDEFMQMSGRAGRRGKDPEGYVIYCPLRSIEPKHEILSLLKGKSLKLTSQYNESANTFLRLLNTTPYDEICAFYKRTLYGSEQTMGVAYYEKEYAELEEALRMIREVELTDDEKEVVRLYMKLTIPATPLPSKNSTTPILPFVISDAIVPNETAGARHAK